MGSGYNCIQWPGLPGEGLEVVAAGYLPPLLPVLATSVVGIVN